MVKITLFCINYQCLWKNMSLEKYILVYFEGQYKILNHYIIHFRAEQLAYSEWQSWLYHLFGSSEEQFRKAVRVNQKTKKKHSLQEASENDKILCGYTNSFRTFYFCTHFSYSIQYQNHFCIKRIYFSKHISTRHCSYLANILTIYSCFSYKTKAVHTYPMVAYVKFKGQYPSPLCVSFQSLFSQQPTQRNITKVTEKYLKN